jgi:hypothetical protein
MANIEAQIKPTGMSQRNLVDLLYMIVSSFHGICAKLDLDDNTDATYEADVFTAIFNGYIEDSRGNSIINRVTAKDDRFFFITPNGLDNKALLECLYQIFDMMETLTAQCDADNLSSDNYEALIYTAHYLWIIENCKGDQLGNGTEFYFRAGSENRKELIDLLYAVVHSFETLTEKLDTDAVPSGTDYEEHWFTDTFLLRVENSQGSVVGNDITITP